MYRLMYTVDTADSQGARSYPTNGAVGHLLLVYTEMQMQGAIEFKGTVPYLSYLFASSQVRLAPTVCAIRK